MRTMKIVLSVLLVAMTTISCTTLKTIKLTQIPNEIEITETLQDFLAANKNPKVVVRGSDVSGEDALLYDAIEEQLAASGFIVRDLSLAQIVINNSKTNTDYPQIKDKSDIDLIIELTQNKSLKYRTNMYTDKKGRAKVEPQIVYEKYGTVMQFRVIIVGSNDVAGTYKFNYTPCTTGCIVEGESTTSQSYNTQGFETVELDAMEKFIKGVTSDLISAMRK